MKTLLGIGAAYGVTVGLLYALGFWGTFDINMLQLDTFVGLASAAAYPMILTMAGGLAGVAMMQVVLGDALPPGGGAESPVGRWGRRWWRILVGAEIGVILAVATFGPSPAKWLIVASLLPLFAVPLSHARLMIELMPSPRMRVVVLFVGLFILGGAFANGRLAATEIIRGHPKYVVDARSVLIAQAVVTSPRLSYVGHLGTKWVLHDPSTGSVILLNDSQIGALVLLRNHAK